MRLCRQIPGSLLSLSLSFFLSLIIRKEQKNKKKRHGKMLMTARAVNGAIEFSAQI